MQVIGDTGGMNTKHVSYENILSMEYIEFQSCLLNGENASQILSLCSTNTEEIEDVFGTRL